MKACLVAALLVGSIVTGSAKGEQSDRQAHEDYLLHCMGCHGEQGRGLAGKVPSFPDDLGRLLTSPGGREFIQRVPGVTQSELTSERLAAVLNWIVRQFAPPEVSERTAPFSAAEVDRLRTQPLLEVAGERPEL
jgi:mono/diheme cytochrome c family protein